MVDAEISGYGPKMLALSEKQRRYVLAMLSDPLGNPTRWARAAGYSDAAQGAKVRGHYLSHNPEILEAAQEEARRHLDTVGPVLGIGVMMQIARTKGHKQQLAAAEKLANRSGFHELSEHKVSVSHSDRRGAALEGRIRELGERLGVDVAGLLGRNAVPALPAVVEAEFSEVSSKEGRDEGGVEGRDDGAGGGGAADVRGGAGDGAATTGAAEPGGAGDRGASAAAGPGG